MRVPNGGIAVSDATGDIEAGYYSQPYVDNEALSARVGVSLPDNEARLVCCHPSCEDIHPDYLRIGKLYVSLGRSVAQASYAVHLYSNDKVRVKGELAQKIDAFGTSIASMLYEAYSLEDFVIIGPAERADREHKDIAERLIAAIYRTHGFLDVTEFLRPFFGKEPSMSDGAYKNLVQNYAQSMRLIPKYSVLGISGPDHRRAYTVELDIGGETSQATAIGKKRAETEAAKAFAHERGIEPAAKTRRSVNSGSNKPIRDSKRISELKNAVISLGLQGSGISVDYLDLALTHASFSGENRGLETSECLNILGSCLIDMLCFDFIEERYDLEKTEFDAEKTQLLKEENLAKVVPLEVLKSLRVGRALACQKTASQDGMKVAVIKSVFAGMWLSYYERESAAAEAFAREYVYKLLKRASDSIVPDYRSLVQDIVQKCGFEYEESYEHSTTYAPTLRHAFTATVRLGKNGWQSLHAGRGFSKKEARNRALRSTVADVARRFPDDDRLAALFSAMEPERQCFGKDASDRAVAEPEQAGITDARGGTDEGRRPKPDTAKQAPDADRVEQERKESQVEKNEPTSKKPGLEKKAGGRGGESKRSTSPTNRQESVMFNGPSAVLHICKGTIACRRKGHEIVPATGVITALSGKALKINVNHCPECDLYFISYGEYAHYRERYGAVLGNFMFDGAAAATGGGYGDLAQESLLMACGYTVSQAEDLSPKQRRLILANMMDRGIMAKPRIIEYLRFFIANCGRRRNMSRAKKKWQDDLAWVRDYRINQQSIFNIDAIVKFK